MQKKIIVFDFDMTLIRVNSFPKWVLFLIFKSVSSLRLSTLTEITESIIQRKILKKLSHTDFKQNLTSLNIPDNWIEQFGFYLSKKVNDQVLSEIFEHLGRNSIVIISSAAPQHYLITALRNILGSKFEFVHVLGSKFIDDRYFDNYKENKCVSLSSILLMHPFASFDTLYTDSWDDFPLASMAQTIMLVNPPSQDRSIYLRSTLASKVKLL